MNNTEYIISKLCDNPIYYMIGACLVIILLLNLLYKRLPNCLKPLALYQEDKNKNDFLKTTLTVFIILWAMPISIIYIDTVDKGLTFFDEKNNFFVDNFILNYSCWLYAIAIILLVLKIRKHLKTKKDNNIFAKLYVEYSLQAILYFLITINLSFIIYFFDRLDTLIERFL